MHSFGTNRLNKCLKTTFWEEIYCSSHIKYDTSHWEHVIPCHIAACVSIISVIVIVIVFFLFAFFICPWIWFLVIIPLPPLFLILWKVLECDQHLNHEYAIKKTLAHLLSSFISVCWGLVLRRIHPPARCNFNMFVILIKTRLWSVKYFFEIVWFSSENIFWEVRELWFLIYT